MDKVVKLSFKKEEYQELRSIAKLNKTTLKAVIYNLIFRGIGEKGLIKIKIKNGSKTTK